MDSNRKWEFYYLALCLIISLSLSFCVSVCLSLSLFHAPFASIPLIFSSTPLSLTSPLHQIDSKILSWWDYGYQMSAMANRTVLVDNNTWNNTHIATVGKNKILIKSFGVSINILHFLFNFYFFCHFLFPILFAIFFHVFSFTFLVFKDQAICCHCE